MPVKVYKVEVRAVAPGQEAEAVVEEPPRLRDEFADETLCPVLGRPLYDAIALAPCGDTM